jgi:hypothetical protein
MSFWNHIPAINFKTTGTEAHFQQIFQECFSVDSATGRCCHHYFRQLTPC